MAELYALLQLYRIITKPIMIVALLVAYQGGGEEEEPEDAHPNPRPEERKIERLDTSQEDNLFNQDDAETLKFLLVL
jgi:hypothetical protein